MTSPTDAVPLTANTPGLPDVPRRLIEIDDAIRRGLKDDLRRQLLDELSSPFFSDATLKVGD